MAASVSYYIPLLFYCSYFVCSAVFAGMSVTKVGKRLPDKCPFPPATVCHL